MNENIVFTHFFLSSSLTGAFVNNKMSGQSSSLDWTKILSQSDVIFFKIFPCLTPKDLFRLRATNKSCYALVNDYFKSHTSLVIDSAFLQSWTRKGHLGDSNNAIKPINLLANHTGGLTRLEIRDCGENQVCFTKVIVFVDFHERPLVELDRLLGHSELNGF